VTPGRRLGRVAAAAALLGLAACAHTVRIESEPPGASVRIDRKLVGFTPLEIDLPWRPMFVKDYKVVVRLTGHRTVRASLRDDMRLWRPVWRAVWHPLELLRGCPEAGEDYAGFGTCPDHTLRFVMIEGHGPVGTWTPEEVQ
jgi:hypothetical protein